MADRHGKVSKWILETRYRVTFMTLDGMQTEERLDRDGLTKNELEAMERQRLHAANLIFAKLEIMSRERVLYGMSKDQFFQTASVIEREPALDIL